MKIKKDREKSQYNSAGVYLNACKQINKHSRTYFFKTHPVHKWLSTCQAELLCKENLILLLCLWEIPGVHIEVYIYMCIHAEPKLISPIAPLSLFNVKFDCAQGFSNTQATVLLIPPQRTNYGKQDVKMGERERE